MKIAIRVDASEKIGTGHFMRCLSLANELRRRGAQTCFVSRHMLEHFQGMLAQHGHEFLQLPPAVDQRIVDELAHAAWLGTSQAVDAQASLAALANRSLDWLIVDHYALDLRWESVLRRVARKILVIDDLADRQHDCDMLLDQNFYRDMLGRYAGKVPAYCQLLLGPRFALLRDEFRELHEKARPRQGTVERLLVFFGGVDAENYTGLALRALAEAVAGDIQVEVVLGAQHPFREEIESTCAQYGYFCHVQTTRMAELMAVADLAIGAGGTATWERCCLGLPSIAISTADNQRRQLADAATVGLVYSPEVMNDVQAVLARHLNVLMENAALRQLISSSGMKYIDGRGVIRVAARMGCTGIEIRQARSDDSKGLHAWRNHPTIRGVSRNAEPIAWVDHDRWFVSALDDPSRRLLIGQRNGESVGVVRFDIQNEQAEVSIYLVPDAKAECRGGDLLLAAEIWLAENCPDVQILHAHVLGANAGSQGLFMAAGYKVENTLYSKKLH